MTLFSESGILSVKTGGQREIAQMEEQEKQRLFEIAGKYEDCVYIEVSSVQSGSTLVYHLGDAVGIVKPGVHIGMFQDMVINVGSSKSLLLVGLQSYNRNKLIADTNEIGRASCRERVFPLV